MAWVLEPALLPVLRLDMRLVEGDIMINHHLMNTVLSQIVEVELECCDRHQLDAAMAPCQVIQPLG
jgi:hypothetical protein